MTGTYDIRPMQRGDLDRAIDWAAAEGWNPGLTDAAAFRAADPGGFVCGWRGGEMVSAISVVNYGTDFAFLGFYIVAPGHRGRGYGLRLWQEAVGHAGGRLIGLDGVLDQQANYARSGFRLAHRNIRFGGVPVIEEASSGSDIEIVALSAADDRVEALDRRCFPAARRAFLSEWIGGPDHVALTAPSGGALAGYGVIRPCRTGHKIGPLFAETDGAASALVRALIARRAGPRGEVFLDVPEPNAPAVDLARGLGLAPVFETARMYTGPAPDIALDRVYGITTFELG